MVKAAIFGATGYTGVELVRILNSHPGAELSVLTANKSAGAAICEIYPHLLGVVDNICEKSLAQAAAGCDIVFTALPHGASKAFVPGLIEAGHRVIDFSGDYRYDDPLVYEKWYGNKHTSPELLDISVYGLPELWREKIAGARLVGNPGCYTTCAILALAPLVKSGLVKKDTIIVDAISGVSGAGRGLGIDFHFCECTENLKAYKLATHRHTSEIEQELSHMAGEDVVITFSPHLAPLKRGIMATSYAALKSPMKAGELNALYKDFYRDEFFVRVYDEGKLPETNHVAGSNFVDIGTAVDERTGRAIIVSCIDNLGKGAAGQAVQNMNIMLGLDEREGLAAPGFYI